MTTDNRTNEPTPEQVEAAMFQLFPITVRYDGCDVPNPGAADKREGFKAGIEYMRGLLSEGAPSEEQARAIRKLDNVQAILAGAQASVTDAVRELSLTSAALVAAQGAARPVNGFDTTAERVKAGADSLHVAPQEPSQTETKSGNNFVSLDPEKVAEVIHAEDSGGVATGAWVNKPYSRVLARALCEAYTEGKLTK